MARGNKTWYNGVVEDMTLWPEVTRLGIMVLWRI